MRWQVQVHDCLLLFHRPEQSRKIFLTLNSPPCATEHKTKHTVSLVEKYLSADVQTTVKTLVKKKATAHSMPEKLQKSRTNHLLITTSCPFVRRTCRLKVATTFASFPAKQPSYLRRDPSHRSAVNVRVAWKGHQKTSMTREPSTVKIIQDGVFSPHTLLGREIKRERGTRWRSRGSLIELETIMYVREPITGKQLNIHRPRFLHSGLILMLRLNELWSLIFKTTPMAFEMKMVALLTPSAEFAYVKTVVD